MFGSFSRFFQTILGVFRNAVFAEFHSSSHGHQLNTALQLLIDALFVNKWATMTAEGGPLGLGTVPADAGAKTSAP